ncbi:MAG TPA: response regulator transcription factor [Bacteroidota bacterium]|nr:response regulator transcription factor [Bacteroidota bacterium]
MDDRILLLEDDPNLGFVIREHLEAHGFSVMLRANGVDGLTETSKARFDLLLVDVMMPKKDGFTFTKEFRAKDTATPIIFLTAKALKEDRVQGFRIGGDDYVTKPFSIDELLLRIKAVLRRTKGAVPADDGEGTYRIGKLTFDARRQLLTGAKTEQNLTSREAQLLRMLASRPNRLVERTEILKSVWGDDTIFNGRSLDVFVSKLRKYLAADPAVEIKNAHGKGYRLVVP